MALIIHDYDSETELVCEYEGYLFDLGRCIDDGYSFGNWYMKVIDEEGIVCAEGWIDDSSSYGPVKAMEMACSEVELDAPKHWPIHTEKLKD